MELLFTGSRVGVKEPPENLTRVELSTGSYSEKTAKLQSFLEQSMGNGWVRILKITNCIRYSEYVPEGPIPMHSLVDHVVWLGEGGEKGRDGYRGREIGSFIRNLEENESWCKERELDALHSAVLIKQGGRNYSLRVKMVSDVGLIDSSIVYEFTKANDEG